MPRPEPYRFYVTEVTDFPQDSDYNVVTLKALVLDNDALLMDTAGPGCGIFDISSDTLATLVAPVDGKPEIYSNGDIPDEFL